MIVEFENSEIKLPDFLIVGAARSGTTVLYSYLSKHPQIFMPEEKEPMFFAQWGQDPLYHSFKRGRVKKPLKHIVGDMDEYLKLFSEVKGELIIGEASTWYLYAYQRVIPNIIKLYGDNVRKLKIIAILRNPADRAWSHYLLNRMFGRESLGFLQAIRPDTIRLRLDNQIQYSYDYIGLSRYYDQIKAFKETFPQMKSIIFEDFIQNLARSFSEVCRFLAVDPNWKPDKIKRLYVSGRPKNFLAAQIENLVYKPNILRECFKFLIPAPMRKRIRLSLGDKILKRESLSNRKRHVLIETFKPDIEKLAGLLKTDLTHWMK